MACKKLRAYRFSYPSYLEQKETAAFLDKVNSSVLGRVDSIQREINLLREYRTRLIADVVTGKLDVRGAELPELDEAEEIGEAVEEKLEDSGELEAVEESADAD